MPYRTLVYRKHGLPYWSTRWKKIYPQTKKQENLISVKHFTGDLNVVYESWKSIISSVDEDRRESLLSSVLALQEILFKDYDGVLAVSGNRVIGVASIDPETKQSSIIAASPMDVLQKHDRHIKSFLNDGLKKYLAASPDDLQKELEAELEKAKVAFHEYDAFPEHPVAVKDHEEYFKPKTEIGAHSVGYASDVPNDVLKSIQHEGLIIGKYISVVTKYIDNLYGRAPAIYTFSFDDWAYFPKIDETKLMKMVFVAMTPGIQRNTEVHDYQVTHNSGETTRKIWQAVKRKYGEDISHIKEPEYATLESIPASNIILGEEIVQKLGANTEEKYDRLAIRKAIENIIRKRQKMNILKASIEIHVWKPDQLESGIDNMIQENMEDYYKIQDDPNLKIRKDFGTMLSGREEYSKHPRFLERISMKPSLTAEEINLMNKKNSLHLLKEWLEAQKVAHHKHDGFSEHPVAVKDHQKYFSKPSENESKLVNVKQTKPKITDESLRIFEMYAKDAVNWNGIPLVGGNVGGSKEERGNLTQLKRAGLITTQIEGPDTWIDFTDTGRRYAASLGINIPNQMTNKSNTWLENQKVAFHKHNAFPEHPVAVKDHEEYLSGSVPNANNIQNIAFSDLELKQIVNVLSKHGVPYLVGGGVRDILLGLPAKDFDIEIYGIPAENLGKILASELGSKEEQVGKVFGVFKVNNFDISLPRTETKTGKKHTDFDIKADPFISTKEAARRRDFTINALMYDVKNNKILDFFGGIEDLKNKVIKYVDEKTFVEDALRVYRAAQFAARLNFSIHPDTIKSARSIDLSNLPKERVYEEFQKMLLRSNRPSIGIQALDNMGVLEKYYPEIAILKSIPQREDYHAEGDVFSHTKIALDKAANIIKRFADDKDKISIMLGVLCHDFGKSSTTKISDKGFPVQPDHEEAGVKPAQAFLSKLTDNVDIIDNVLFLVEHHLLPMHLHRNNAGSSSFIRIINRYGLKKLDLLAAVSEADVTGRFHKINGQMVVPSGEELNWFRQNIKEASEIFGTTQEGKIAPLITGNDLISIGFEEGPQIGQILRDIKEKQEEGQLNSSKNALQYVKDNWLKKAAEYKQQDISKQEVQPDVFTNEFYDYLDNQLQKSSLYIGGNQPRGTKTTGRATELSLYQSLRKAVEKYLNSLTGTETQEEILSGVRKILSGWKVTALNQSNDALAQLFKLGFTAGAVSTGLSGKMGSHDKAALDVITGGKYRIGERIVTFGDEIIPKFASIITEAYTPQGIFSLEDLTQKMKEVVPGERYQLERIVRTETNNISNLGRLWSWNQDPDKYTYAYYWQSTTDNRRREMKRIRSGGNPYSFDEIKFLWLNNEQQLSNGKFQNGSINCRCTISRSPVDNELRGDRFENQEHLFKQTIDFEF